jgi:hypothetical protein
MQKDKKSRDEYPKLSGNDKRWKEQDEFDSGGALRELDDEDKNQSISQADDHAPNADKKNADPSQENDNPDSKVP